MMTMNPSCSVVLSLCRLLLCLLLSGPVLLWPVLAVPAETDIGDCPDEAQDEPDDESQDCEQDPDDQRTRPERFYITREDRRDSLPRHQLTDQLSVALFAEYEYLRETAYKLDGQSHTGSENARSVELDMTLVLADWLSIEAVYEYDDQDRQDKLDEAVLIAEWGDVEAELGVLYMPFGEYPSHFVSGPLTELGEVRDKGMVLSWAIAEPLEVAAFGYLGRTERVGRSSQSVDYGLSLEWQASRAKLGLGYLSDLGDSDERLFEEESNRSLNRVDALIAYGLWGLGPLEFNVEVLSALKAFEDLEPGFDQPLIWNAEAAWYPGSQFELAAKWEGSQDWLDTPSRRYGLSAGWVWHDRWFVRAELLRSRFRVAAADDDDDLEAGLRRSTSIGLQVGLQF